MLTLFIIVLIAFVLGVWQSQRLSLPIVNLADTAAKFRQGNLDTSVSIQSSVLEIYFGIYAVLALFTFLIFWETFFDTQRPDRDRSSK